jgi:hypothetical protein
MTVETLRCLLQSSFIVRGINDLWHTRDVPITLDGVQAIERHGDPTHNQKTQLGMDMPGIEVVSGQCAQQSG